MSDRPPSASNAAPNADGYPDHILKLGLSALKHSDYSTAIAHFSRLAQDQQVPGAMRLKAHIGWVKALRGDGQTAAAIDRCRPLTRHPQPKVKSWAIATLADLTPPSPPAPAADSAPDVTGFRPLEAPEATGEASPYTPPAASSKDLRGFQPLSAPSPLFTDDERPPSVEAPGQPATDPTSPAESPTTAEQTPTPPSASEPPSSEPSSTDSASLFHYLQLNQGVPPEAAIAPAHRDPYNPVSAETPPPPSDEATDPPELTFQHAGRLDRPRSLPQKPSILWQVWLSQVISAIVLFWVCRALVQTGVSLLRPPLLLWARFLPISLRWTTREQTVPVLLVLGILLLASPWLLDWIFRKTTGLNPLPIQKLQKTHPEGCRLLRRVCQKRGWLIPVLQEMPTDVPLMFSYGWMPRNYRIVISRGVLATLSDEELATLMGYELTHLTTWTLSWMSLVAALLQLSYQGYWQTARWGDRCTARFSKVSAAVGSTLCYGFFWLVRKINLPASRSRVLMGDRQAVLWTGNPNALTRALVKLTANTAETIVRSGHTPPILESTDLLTPQGYEAAITLGSLFPSPAFLRALAWDMQNPYRRWLSINSSHPRLGERLKQLSGYSLHWRLEPELSIDELVAAQPSATKSDFWKHRSEFLTQISPYIGPALGIVFAMVLWFLGGIFEPLGLQRVGWVYGDRSVLWGSLLLGLGMGIMARINAYFPDITLNNRLKSPSLSTLVDNSLALPTASQPVRLEGTLLGRKGMANWLCQDFILQTSSGLLKLHFFSSLGPIGNPLIHPQHPVAQVGRPMEVEGWFRRGAIAWMDVELFLRAGKVVARAQHPKWSAILSLACCGLGLLSLFRG